MYYCFQQSTKSDYYHPPVKREMAGLFNTVPLAEANQYHNDSFNEQVIIRFTKHNYAPVITASEEMFIEQNNNGSKHDFMPIIHYYGQWLL